MSRLVDYRLGNTRTFVGKTRPPAAGSDLQTPSIAFLCALPNGVAARRNLGCVAVGILCRAKEMFVVNGKTIPLLLIEREMLPSESLSVQVRLKSCARLCHECKSNR